ncbi:MAG: hypothetical protein IJ752_06460 [Alphaproteobacteria bacterium]|nr:hypothetical protein [Alphaproteobacteria bacterium]
MEIPPVDSVFDAAEWFLDTALNDGEYLQPMKMQYLMFLAQGYYAALTQGKRFIPAVFLATERGPVEPNSYRLYGSERPVLQQRRMNRVTASFLQTIWARFGAYSPDYIYRLISAHAPYVDAFASGQNTEINLSAMADFYAGRAEKDERLKNAEFGTTRILRSQTGKAVAVKKWIPQKK